MAASSTFLALTLAAAGITLLSAPSATTADTASPLYKDPTQPIPARVADLLPRLSLHQQVMQLQQPWDTEDPAGIWAKYGGADGSVGAWYLPMLKSNGTPADLVRARNEVQSMFVHNTTLGVPVTFVQETLHGGARHGTVFPMPINFACTWDPSLMQQAASIAALEARATGADRGFSPVINVFTDPRYGRLQEGFSEDPLLTAEFGIAHLLGLQGGATGGPTTYLNNFSTALVGTVKHYAAYGMSAGGIDGSPAVLSEQVLREVYLAPWRALVPNGLRSVMAAQNMVNGRPMHANKRLLTKVLREEWGVTDALVESDGSDCIGALWQGFHIVPDRESAAVVSLEAGMDMDLGGVTLPLLEDAVNSGRLNASLVAAAAGRVLASKFASGIFDQPMVDPARVAILDSPQHRALARTVAQQGIVLLVNPGTSPVLPLSPSTLSSVAVIGPLADDGDSQCGGYSSLGAEVVTVLDAVTAAGSASGFTVTYAQGANTGDSNTSMIPAAVQAASTADLSVFVLGDSLVTCGEMFDRADLDLPGAQLQLLQQAGGAAAAAGKKVVVVLIHGRSATLGPDNSMLPPSATLLTAWRPGEEGGSAVWDVITGAVNPSGKLTQAWPRSVGQVHGPGQPYLYPEQGDHFGESYVFSPSTAMFEFGHGLSYTSFTLSGMTAAPAVVAPTRNITIKLQVHNKGARDGATVVQVYARDPVAPVVRISKLRLVAFQRVETKAGATVGVTITMPAERLAYYDDEVPGFMVDPGAFDLYAGYDGCRNIMTMGLHASVNVTSGL